MIWKCVDDDAVMPEAERLATYFAAQPRAALAATKAALLQSWTNTPNAQRELERLEQQKLGFSADYAEGVSAFLARRTPQYGKTQ